MLSPSQKKASEAGTVFEFGFKLGLLRCFVEKGIDVSNYNQILNSLKDFIINKEGNFAVVKYLSSRINEIKSPLIPSPLRNLRDKSLIEILRSEYTMNKEDKFYLSSYVIGTYSGYLFAEQRIKFQVDISKVYPKNFGLETITDKGSHLNVDLLILTESKSHKRSLYLYELKFTYGKYLIERLLEDDSNAQSDLLIPPETKGYTFAPALGSYELEDYVTNFISTVKSKLESEITDPETLILLQVLSYLFDYLYFELSQGSKELEKIEQISFGYIGGVVEGISQYFPIREGWFRENQDLVRLLAIEIKELYDRATLQGIKSEVFQSIESMSKFKRLYSKLENNYETLRSEALRRSLEILEITPKRTVEDLKTQVNEQIRRCLCEGSPWGKAFLFAHSQGSGKTTSFIRTFFSPEASPYIAFYFAPRKQLLSRVEKDVRDLNSKVEIISSTSEEFLKSCQRAKASGSRVYGQEIEDLDWQDAGKIDVAIDLVIERIKKGHRGPILSLLTTQSICKVQAEGNEPLWTIRHFLRLLMTLEEKGLTIYYKIPIVIDEITGSENGFEAVRTVLQLIKETAPLACAFLFDASLHSKDIAQKALVEYETKGFLSPCLFPSTLNEIEGDIRFDSFPVKVFSGHSYPAKLIKVQKRFLIYDDLPYPEGIERLISDVAQLVKDTLLKDIKEGAKSVFVYVQNRDFIFNLSERLRDSGLKVGYFTGTGKSEGKSLSRYEVILATSTLSRGIDIKDTKTVILINTNYLSPEQAQVEEVQAVVRLRGNKNDSEIEKRILKVYAVLTPTAETQAGFEDAFLEELESFYGELDAETVIKIKRLMELDRRIKALKNALAYDKLSDNVLQSFFSPQDRVIVPFGLQLPQVFKPNNLAEIEQILLSISDILTCLQTGGVSGKGIFHALESIKILSQLRRQTVHMSEVFKNFQFCFPPLVLTQGVLESTTEDRGNLVEIERQLDKLRYHIRQLKKDAYEIYPEFFNEVESTLEKITLKEFFRFKFIVYIPLIAILNEVIEREFPQVRLLPKKYITRRYLPVCFSKIETNPLRFEEERLKIRENFPRLRKSAWARHFAAFPVTESTAYQALGSLYPRISPEEFIKMLKEE